MHDNRPITGEFPNRIAYLVKEPTIVTDCHDATIIVLQSFFQCFLGIRIQMIGGFIQQQHVVFFKEQFEHGNPSSLASTYFLEWS